MTFVLVVAGFALLAAGSWRPSALIFGRVPMRTSRHALLYCGYALLAASLVPVLGGGDPARVLVEWFGLLTLAAILLLIALWLRHQRQDRRR